MELKLGDWVKLRGFSRVYIVEGLPSRDSRSPLLTLGGLKYRPNMREVVEVRRDPSYLFGMEVKVSND